MKIGIIGGGQLGLMIAEAAKDLGHEIYSLDSNEDCPIKTVTDHHIVADFDDTMSINKLIDMTDVVTYEFENIILDDIEDENNKIIQGIETLKISQNRLLEKNTISAMNVKTAKYRGLDTIDTIEFPSIIKSISGGYDGKNQFVIRNQNDIDQLMKIDRKYYILEEMIDFDYEISVICTRDIFNDIVAFPIPINTHKNGILFTSIIDCSISKNIMETAVNTSKRIIEHLNYIGTMAIEYFVVGNELLFNEFAPRPHNSGHYTIEACNVSQFKNHVLAITGEHVIEPVLKNNAIMLNILGQNNNYIEKSKGYSDAHLHLYGKKEYRKNRKIGHITITSKDNLSVLNEITKE